LHKSSELPIGFVQPSTRDATFTAVNSKSN
jgi:hypothetical protein